MEMGVFVSLLLILIYFQFAKGISDSSCCPDYFSRFDYDFKVMQKLVNLENRVDSIDKKVDQQLGKPLQGDKDEASCPKVCPNGWVVYEGSCYLFGTTNLTFLEAQKYCKQSNSAMVNVQTAEENNFLKGYMRNSLKGPMYWLGITDQATEGIWRFGEHKTAYFDWQLGQPNLESEDCATFYIGYDYKWGDFLCDVRAPYVVCEM